MIRRAATGLISSTAAAIAAAVLFLPSSAEAQMRVPMPTTPSRRVCDASLRLLSVRVVDAHGAPVPGATIEVRSVESGKVVFHADHVPGVDGTYAVMDDSFIQELARHGSTYTITATRGTASGMVRWRVALDPQGCHLARVDGADTIRFG